MTALPTLDTYDHQGLRASDAPWWGADAVDALDELLALDLDALADELG